MASNSVREKLRRLLKQRQNYDNAENFTNELVWLNNIKSWIQFHCPTLHIYIVQGK